MSFKFNKFMKDILRREEQQQVHEPNNNEPEENSAREYRRRYTEVWQNRIVWGKKDEKKRNTNS